MAHKMKMKWLTGVVHTWFNGLGIFRRYKEPTVSRVSTMVGSLMSHARSEYPRDNHSNDATGAEDENIPEFVRLVREFDDWKGTRPSVNTQQMAARITNAVVQRTLMDNHPPVG